MGIYSCPYCKTENTLLLRKIYNEGRQKIGELWRCNECKQIFPINYVSEEEIKPREIPKVVVRPSPQNRRVFILDAVEKMDALSVPQLEAEFKKLMGLRKYFIVINLAKVNFINSGGLNILLDMVREVRKKRGDLRLACLKPQVYDTFKLAGLNTVFRFYKSEEEAVSSFQDMMTSSRWLDLDEL